MTRDYEVIDLLIDDPLHGKAGNPFLVDREWVDGKPSDDWNFWPSYNKTICEYAVKKLTDSLVPDAKIIKDVSGCSVRHDLASEPWQLWRTVTVETT